MTEFSELPQLERIKRYRQMATEARHAGNRSTGHMREAYLLIAERWESLDVEEASTTVALKTPNPATWP